MLLALVKFGQNLIIKGLEKQKKLVGKPPPFVLDNLRSASGYNENEADAWRPIGKCLCEIDKNVEFIRKGYKFLAIGTDMTFLGNTCREKLSKVKK